jgi:hypothetical protein
MDKISNERIKYIEDTINGWKWSNKLCKSN